MVQSDQVFYIWNGEFCKKITLLHSKVDVKAPKSIHLMGKTQLKSTKGVLVSNKMLELWVKLLVSDHGLIWLGFLNWNYSFVSKSISLHPKLEILAPKKSLLYVKAQQKSKNVGFASTHNLENHGCWITNCTVLTRPLT